MTTERNLLRAVREEPDADEHRLVYADWLDENEQGERAEFIRLQCRIAEIQRDCGCGACVKVRGGGQHHNGPCGISRERSIQPDGSSRQSFLRQRELDLWLQVRESYEPSGIQFVIENGRMRDQHRPTHAIVRRGFPDAVTLTMSQFMGGECVRCEGRGEVCEMCDGEYAHNGCLKCETCHGTGQTPGLARELFERWPITGVRLSDRKPAEHNSEYFWKFREYHSPIPGHLESVIPNELFRLITSTGYVTIRDYPTRDAAHAALSDAACRYGRGLVGLRAIHNPKVTP